MLYSLFVLALTLFAHQGFAEEGMLANDKRDSYMQCMSATNNCEHFVNGICKDFFGRGDFSCVCKPGWTGTKCDVETEQSRDMETLTAMLEKRDSYMQCMAATNNCETLVNGICKDYLGRGDYSCVCKDGWTGSKCDQETEQTREMEDLAMLFEKRDSYMQCMSSTNNCETLVNGICRDFYGRGDYSCVCKEGWTGTACDVKTQQTRDLGYLKQMFEKRDSFNQCMAATNDCDHLANGVCADTYNTGDYSCVCQDGWKGSNCDVPVKQSRNLDQYLRELLEMVNED